MNRRSFLTKVAGLAAVPLALRAFAKPAEPSVADFTVNGSPGQTGILVQGHAIKVPSNRHVYWDYVSTGGAEPFMVRYEGDWDGTFKMERGCTNPAYILADLYERTGAEPDWVVGTKAVITPSVAYLSERRHLNWQMLYDWGVWCDEIADEPHHVTCCAMTVDIPHVPLRGPRLSVATVVREPKHIELLRETLCMHCLNWQAEDPRYRTSYPGIPYPGEEVSA